MFFWKKTKPYTSSFSDDIHRISEAIKEADTIIVGAGAGLSSSAGFLYSGEPFERNFADFKEKYGIRDMYSGGFYPFETLEEYWAWWSRHIYYNRYVPAQKPVYERLKELVGDKDYFVITTNVDHQFQQAGFDKERLFYTQGDYGLWQCSRPCHRRTYDNRDTVLEMLHRQNDMKVPTDLIPRCPHCGAPMTMNLRIDGSFVEDEGWHNAAGRYEAFLNSHKNKRTVFLELGVGGNTPVIIKYPFCRMTAQWANALYVCINLGEAYAPNEIKAKSICLDADIAAVIDELLKIK